VVTVDGRGEGRGYTRAGVYGVAAVAAGMQTTYVGLDRANPDQDDLRDTRLAANLGLEVGVGYGRVLDVGARQRARRLARVLEAARALGRPIDDQLAERLQRAWWAVRGEHGDHRRLVTTVALLREAGVLLGEPDAGLTYELLEVLRDPAYDAREHGLDVQLVFAESYLLHEEVANSPLHQDGRVEQVLVRAAYARQLPGDTSDLTGAGFARLRVLAGDGEAAPWALGGSARLRRFAYGEHMDPRGVIDLSIEAALTDDDLDQTDRALRVGVSGGWSLAWSRASWVRLGGDVAIEAGELFVGASLAASYGLLDGTFARKAP
jgi:hypothetical protein